MPQARLTANTAPRCLGIDVSKAEVVICDLACGRTVTAANTPQALKAARAPFAAYDLAVCETTGGYERAALEAAFTLGLAIHRADASRIKAYIASHGERAKTDAIDALWLARYAAERGNAVSRGRPPSPEQEALADLVRHRRDRLAKGKPKRLALATVARKLAVIANAKIRDLSKTQQLTG